MIRRTTAAFLVVASIAGSAAADSTNWQGPPDQAADWFTPANWTNGVPTGIYYEAVVDNGGTARVAAGGATSPSLRLGIDHSGSLVLDAGMLELTYGTVLGYSADSHGEIQVNGGKLKSQAISIGASFGSGNVTQVGGTVDSQIISLGGNGNWSWFGQPEDFGKGEYDLLGGKVTTTQMKVGDSGVGTFRQNGGTATVAVLLKVGGAVGALPNPFPVVEPTTFPATITSPFIDIHADALSTSSNASSVVTDVWYPPSTPSVGLYELSGGALATNNTIVDHTGTFRQSGGSHTTNYINVFQDGRYELRGGALNVSAGVNIDGSFDFAHTSSTLTAGGALLNFSQGLSAAENARIQAGADSLTIFPAGFNPATQLGSYSTQGLTHFAGTDLTIHAGKTIRGAGHIDDFTTVTGKIIAADNQGITLKTGLDLQAGAQVNLGSGGVVAADLRTAIRGGILKAQSLVVAGTLQYFPGDPVVDGVYQLFLPQTSPGRVRQSGGMVDVNSVSVVAGAYSLSAGSITSDAIMVGPGSSVNYFSQPTADQAFFFQSSGHVQTRQLSITPQYLYVLATDGVPAMQSSAAPRLVTSATMAASPADAYILSNGSLVADSISIASSLYQVSSRFSQTGGSVEVTRRIQLYGPQSSYEMLGGSLRTRRLEIGGTYETVARSGKLSLRSEAASIQIAGELLLGTGAQFDAVPGTTIRFTKVEPLDDWPVLTGDRLAIHSTSSSDLAGLQNLKVIFDGGLSVAATLEAAGKDLGSTPSAFLGNFTLHTLQVGGLSPAKLSLVDLVDNQLDGISSEAVYVDHLIVRPGSILDLAGLHLYYHTADIAPGSVTNGTMLIVAMVPEPPVAVLFGFALFFAGAIRGDWRRTRAAQSV